MSGFRMIPTSERLPGPDDVLENDNILFETVDRYQHIGRFTEGRAQGSFDVWTTEDGRHFATESVAAWMPLPAPYWLTGRR